MSEPDVAGAFGDPNFPSMGEICQDQHPEGQVVCEKPKPCYGYHLASSWDSELGPQAITWTNEAMPPKPTKDGDRKKADDMAKRVKANGPGQTGADDGPTQIGAANLVAPKTGTQRHQVLVAIHGAGDNGMTDSEAAAATGLWAYSVVPRRGELTKDGWVADSGRTRPSERGGEQIVWVMTQAGLDAFSLI